ncbi:SDR family oxidoreductase [Micrococcales bacterium 31B]|nr:SDR family oxidoreductase [Micrococcales bacterium 31B]
MDLTGRVAFVTGSTRGIGLCTVRLLAQHGCKVVVSGSSELAQIEPIAREIGSEFGVDALALQCDSRNPDQMRQVYREIKSAFGGLDVLVNNAGIMSQGLAGMIPDDDITATLDVNSAAPIHHMQNAVKLMRRKKSGSIVNLASIMGTNGTDGLITYSASKAAVIGATKAAAKEFGKLGVRVNALAPGVIDTDMIKVIPPDTLQERLDYTPLGRLGSPDDVARAALFLASDLSSFVTGQVIGVDGGLII